MMRRKIFCLVLLFCSVGGVLRAEGVQDLQHNCCLQGYLQGMLDAYFQEYRVRVYVEGSTAYLYHLPQNRLWACWITRFVRGFPCVKKVVAVDYCSGPPHVPFCRPFGDVRGFWFPQENKLFQPIIADPRQVTYSAAWRFHDDIVQASVGAVSFGNSFPLFRWIGVTKWCCDAQLDLEGGVWAVFRCDRDMRSEQSDSIALVNCDYYVGIVGTVLCGNWSYRGRFYHVSSHLGDEFMCEHPECERVNPSREAVDLFVSYQFGFPVRVYGGIGVNTRSNSTFEIDPLYLEYGTEIRVAGWASCYFCLFFQPFLAMHFRNWEYMDWNFDATYQLGLEISDFAGLRRKVRVFFEYHDGYSVEGQFAKGRTNFFAFRMSWGF